MKKVIYLFFILLVGSLVSFGQVGLPIPNDLSKVNKKIQFDSLEFTIPLANENFNDKSFIYTSIQNDQDAILIKTLIDPNNRSAKVVDSVKIENAYIRYLGADDMNRIYMSCLPILEGESIAINNIKHSVGSDKTNLKLVYVLDGTTLNIIDSIVYTGNNINLTRVHVFGSIFTPVNDGFCILNRLTYSPRSNKFDTTVVEGNDLFYIYYKSGDQTALLPIPNSIMDDFNHLIDSSKDCVKAFGAIKVNNIQILASDANRIYFTLNLSFKTYKSDSELIFFCQLFSIDKLSGNIEKYLLLKYNKPKKTYTTNKGIVYVSAFNIQQIKLGKESVIFSIAAIKNCRELSMTNDSIYNSIIHINTITKKNKILNISYRPDQLINLSALTTKDLSSKEVINNKTKFKGFDYLGSESSGVIFFKDFSLISRISPSNKFMLYFKN